jgi:hypothetical protein
LPSLHPLTRTPCIYMRRCDNQTESSSLKQWRRKLQTTPITTTGVWFIIQIPTGIPILPAVWSMKRTKWRIATCEVYKWRGHVTWALF